MRIGIANFKGEIPRLHPRLLPDGFAQRAINARLTDGALKPYRATLPVHSFGAPTQTIYRYQNQWLGFNSQVNLVRGPVADDRLYYTGDGQPKILIYGVTYDLALPAPAAPLTVSPSGTLNPAFEETIYYTYTFVTLLGEESAPAPLSAEVLFSPGMTMTLTGFSAPPESRAVFRMRIYRSQTSNTGVTDLYLVKDVFIATAVYVHDLTIDPLAEVLPSLHFDMPPDTMQGLTELPNGMMAAFDGRELLFCEPFQPHAWPIKYRLKTNHTIVGLSAFGDSIAVMTTGTPYIVQGTTPENMQMRRMESNLPCISARSIVDLGYAAAYASNDGLVLVSATSVQIVSRSLFTKPEWQKLVPQSIFAASLEGRYVFAHVTGQLDLIQSGTAPSVDPQAINLGGAQDNAAVTVIDGGYASRPENLLSIGIIDLSGETPFFAKIQASDQTFPVGLYYDTETNTLYSLESDATVREIDAAMQPEMTYVWRSRAFILTREENFGAIWVESNQNPSAVNHLITRVYANGSVIYQTADFNKPERLPSGFTANQWEIEVEGTAHVSAISIASSIEELMV